MNMMEINDMDIGYVYINPNHVCSLEWIEGDRENGISECYLLSMSNGKEYSLSTKSYELQRLISDIEYNSRK